MKEALQETMASLWRRLFFGGIFKTEWSPFRTVKGHGIQENSEVFGFELKQEELDNINVLNEDRRIGSDPDNFDF